MDVVTISSKYQVVIPSAIREQYDLKPGQKLMFLPYNNILHVVIVPTIEKAPGMLKGIDIDVQREEQDREL